LTQAAIDIAVALLGSSCCFGRLYAVICWSHWTSHFDSCCEYFKGLRQFQATLYYISLLKKFDIVIIEVVSMQHQQRNKEFSNFLLELCQQSLAHQMA
jgi:hypothetical protein